MSPEDYSPIHQGYMDGLLGKDPSSRYSEYETGWLHGQEDRGKVSSWETEGTTLKRGDIVVIPKGTRLTRGGGVAKRTFTVKLHDAYPMVPAHVDYRGRFVRPKPAVVLWAGSGGLWKETYAHHVRIEDQKATPEC